MTPLPRIVRMSVRMGAVLVAGALLLPVLPASPAAAHVTASPDEANSPYATTAFRVPHGCDGSATTEVRIQIPDGVMTARPEVVPGWDAEVVPADGAENGADDEDSDDALGAVAEVAWTGGLLPDAHYQEFGLNFQLGEDAPEVLWFPTIQQCEEGEHRWIEIPASVDEWGDLDEPAPYVINGLAATSDDANGAADAAAVGPADQEQQPAVAEETAGGASTVAVVALIAGLLGLVAGLAALALAVRSGRPGPAAG